MLKPSVLPSGSLAVGRKLYAVRTVAVRAGEPLIVGARFVCVGAGVGVVLAAFTAIVNAGSETVFAPSVVEITMFANVPAAVGVPLSSPVTLLNVAQAGLPAIEKYSGSPFASRVVGTNLYAERTATEVAGVPEIVGATFDFDWARSANAGNAVVFTPSLTLIWMLVQ